MKIRTRPKSGEDSVIPAGKYQLIFDEEELKIVAALMYTTRLGMTGYANAASRVMETIEDRMGHSFSAESYDDVQPYITVVDDTGHEIDVLKPDFYIIEVQ